MTPEYKVRRRVKHRAEKAFRAEIRKSGSPVGTIDLTPKIPSLAFLNGKLFKQGNGGRKNCLGHSQEHEQANLENRNPYKGEDGLWYWYDETEQPCENGFVTRDQAEAELNKYGEYLNQPKES